MKTTKLYLALGLGLSLAFTGCSNDTSEPQTETKQVQETTTAPHTVEPAAPVVNEALTGTVKETFDSGGYTYILLDNGNETVWAAIGAAKVEVGQEIALSNGPVMKDFHSRSLDRTFPEIIFSSGIKGANTGGHAMMGKAPAKASDAGSDEDNFMAALGAKDGGAEMMDPTQATGGSSKAVVNAMDIKVDKAPGANSYTVEELYANAKELQGKPAVIQAQVVKISPQIMGKNWLHLQDGSGNALHNTHDLVVTTNDLPELNSVITIEGVVATDKDFGAGYVYEMIVEEGVVKK
jgi:hypothetical protein